jgi:hypothetical protein
MTSLAVDGGAAVRVDIQMGRVQVVASDRDDVTVTVAPGNAHRAGDRRAADGVRIERLGDVVFVRGPRRLNILGPGDAVDVMVEVPIATALTVTVTYGSAQLSGLFGEVRADLPYGEFALESASRVELKGGHGEFRIDSVSGDAVIGFKSGQLRVGRVGGRLRLTGADGRIDIDEVDGPAELSTSSGAIELGTAASDVSVRAAYGAVHIRDIVRGVLRVDGSYGNVEVGVRPGTAVWLDARSQHGAVRSELVADSGPREGEERLEVRVRTGYGSVTIRRNRGQADAAAG